MGRPKRQVFGGSRRPGLYALTVKGAGIQAPGIEEKENSRLSNIHELAEAIYTHIVGGDYHMPGGSPVDVIGYFAE